eukprot:GHVN01082766.1.p1 GENE.GHVN01082766.1~~GHVN01082766.1.p1  ORF type:complete len:191 (+),score=18.45 GHVN01082766.1:48-620(+)
MPSLTCISKFVILAVCCVHFSLCGGRNSRNRLSWLQVGRSPFFNVNGDSTPVGGKGSYKKLLNARRAADIDDGQPGMVKLSELDDYCASLRQTVRFPTRSVNIGKVSIGSNHPIACQTMTTSDTRDVEASVEQVLRCTEAGADIVRWVEEPHHSLNPKSSNLSRGQTDSARFEGSRGRNSNKRAVASKRL